MMLNNEPGGSQTGDTDATETSTPTKDELSKLKNGEHQEVTNASKEGDDLALDNPFGGPDDEIPDEGSLVEETEQDVEQASDENVFDYEEYDLEKQSDEELLCSNAKMAMAQVGRQTCQVWWHCNGGCRCEIVNRRRRQGWCRYNRISPGYYGGGNRCKMGERRRARVSSCPCYHQAANSHTACNGVFTKSSNTRWEKKYHRFQIQIWWAKPWWRCSTKGSGVFGTTPKASSPPTQR